MISRQIIKQDIIQQQKDFSLELTGIPYDLSLFNPGTMSMEMMVDSYDTSLDIATITMLIGLGLLTIQISTIIPILYIVQLNPRKVLM